MSLNDGQKEIIDKKYYLNIRDGGKYFIDLSEKDIEISNQTNFNKKIDLDFIKNSKELSAIPHLDKFKFSFYQIINDSVFFGIYFEHYWITIRYNIEEDELYLFDWQRIVECYDNKYRNLKFKILKDGNLPESVSKYFIT